MSERWLQPSLLHNLRFPPRGPQRQTGRGSHPDTFSHWNFWTTVQGVCVRMHVVVWELEKGDIEMRNQGRAGVKEENGRPSLFSFKQTQWLRLYPTHLIASYLSCVAVLLPDWNFNLFLLLREFSMFLFILKTVHVLQQACDGQRTAFGSQFSTSTMCVLGIKLRSDTNLGSRNVYPLSYPASLIALLPPSVSVCHRIRKGQTKYGTSK